jgi:hypothetical protein
MSRITVTAENGIIIISSLARQPFVSPGLPQNYSPFVLIVGPSGYYFSGILNNGERYTPILMYFEVLY